MEVKSPARAARVRFEGLGPIFAVMPWNLPFWQVIRFFAPAFLAGNTTIVKHAESVPACAEAIERVFAEAGLPDGVLLNIRVDHPTAARIIGDPRIRSVDGDRQRARWSDHRRDCRRGRQEGRARAWRLRSVHRVRRRRFRCGGEDGGRCAAHQLWPELCLRQALPRRKEHRAALYRSLCRCCQGLSRWRSDG